MTRSSHSAPAPRPGAQFDPATGERLPKAPKRGPGVVLRLLGMLLILLPLWIAASMVNSLISEREGVRDGAEQEISGKWGGDQVLAGPVLILPWIERERVGYRDEKGVQRTRVDEHRRTATFLPETMAIKGGLKPELRHRGIFETVLYIADLKVSGRFAPPDIAGLEIDPADVLWDKAVLSVSVSDTRGIRDTVQLDWGGRLIGFEPGPGEGSPFGTGFHATGLPPASLKKGVPYSFDLDLNGSRTFKALPVGRSNRMQLSSSWPDPGFTGEYLPLERHVSDKGFDAAWSVLELARNYPQSWREQRVGGPELAASAFGVGLVRTASTYQQSARATKYAVLFLLLTFSFFFLFEVLGGARVHPVQYLLVGAALVVFYLLLLSLSEQVGFGAAYWIAAAATLTLIGAYVGSVLKEKRRSRLLLAALTGLYGYLFVILRLDDYALLMGSLGVFGALAALMLMTRRIDWYALDGRGKP